MKAAIYARKSTDDNGRDAENKSVTRQVEHAKAYAASKGWTVPDEHVYVDDGVSGAEFKNRPALLRILNALKSFDVIVMSELSRIGRDQIQTAQCLANIEAAGVRVFFYLTNEELKFGTAVDRFITNAVSFAAELEREKASQRARDALERKARHGYNTGGVVYGYDNVKVNGANGTKSHTDYRINEQQADVVRRIFRAYAAGYGHGTIAKALNGDPSYAVVSRRYFDGARPSSPRKGTGSWAPSSVRAMLYNERYTGVVPFGEFRKTYRGGTKTRTRNAAETILRAARPDLRIVADDLWRAVQTRLAAAKKTYVRDTHGKLWGRPGLAVESKYLLTGLGECGCCGHNITMIGGRSGGPGNRRPIYYYGCAYHQARGRTICANEHRARMEEADALVIEKIRGVMTPEGADYTIERAMELIAERLRERGEAPQRLDAEARKLRREIERLVRAIAGGNAPASVVAEIQHREARLAAIDQECAAFAVEIPGELEQRLRRALRERLGQFERLLQSDVPLARQALRKVISGRISFTPTERAGERAYRLHWNLASAALMDGYIGVASPRGTPSFIYQLRTPISGIALPS